MFELIPWRDRGELSPFGREIERFFDGVLERPWRFFGEDKAWTPSVDVSETEKEIRVSAELPGVDPKDINVSFHDGVLTIRGERKHEKEEKDESYHRTERSYGSFARSFRLPGEVDADKVTADYKDGVLKIHMPKTKPDAAKKIEVKAA